MRRKLTIAAAAGIAVVVLFGAGGYLYYFSGLRTAPADLGLSTRPTTTPGSAIDVSALAGTWTVSAGSLAGYRVKELFVGETSKHEAVARTSMVTGTMTVNGDSSGYQVSGITLTVDLNSLHSVDQVVGRNVTQRDSVVMRQLEVQQYPNATFTATSALVPGPVSSPTDVTVAGKLTIHGVTKDVSATARTQLVGDKIEVAASLPINMTDYGVTPPRVPFTAVDPTLTIEFDVFLIRT